MEKYHQLADALLNLEKVMHEVNVWDMPQPSAQALASQQPFCIDTMAFDQWLRFVMIEKFKPMLAQGATLPDSSNIAPMADSFYNGHNDSVKTAIVDALEIIDVCLNQT